ncbi:MULTISPECIES: hypothetical protein [Brevibacillus]|nr:MULTISPECIES: hypothetical protein [Brevibacillus]MCG7318667.1 hypothetical protein [Brevibacillus laterosporus]MED1789953.1 hypothetical protein [Brevibacillus laterosporus]
MKASVWKAFRTYCNISETGHETDVRECAHQLPTGQMISLEQPREAE